ncbi:hypothetical protein PENTCL1PPCAC_24599, partial [Pristionchus entomophagus]
PFMPFSPIRPTLSSLYFLADEVVTITICGYFGSNQFEIGKVYEHINPYNYSFLSSPLEFLLIAVLRAILYGTSQTLKSAGNSVHVSWLAKAIAGFCVASLSFSILKFLIYSDQNELFQWTGVWLLPACNIISTALFYGLWWKEFEGCFEKQESEDEDKVEEDESTVTKTQQILILLRYSTDNWPWMLVGTAISLASSGVDVMMPHYTSLVMNSITTLSQGVDISHAIKILAGLTCARMVLSGLTSGCGMYISSKTESKMSMDLFGSILHQEIAFFDKHKSGALVSRVNSGADCIMDSFTDSLKNIIILIGKVMVMLSLSWRLTLVNFIAFPIIIYMNKQFGEFFEKIGEETTDTSGDSYQVSEEIISSIRTVRSFGAERRSWNRFVDAIETAQRVTRKQSMAMFGIQISYELYQHSIYVAVLIYGVRLVTVGDMPAAALVTLMMYQLQIGDHIMGLTWQIPSLMAILGRSRKFCEFLVRKPEMDMNGTNEQPVRGEIRLDGVSFTYPNRPTNRVLNELTLQIRSGETLALVGPSGAGKSTIVAMLERFYDPDEGSITLDGVPLREYDHEYLHRKIALVAQEPVLYDCSVRDNIGFGCETTEEDIVEAARTANAHDFVTGLDKGYETSCGEKGAQMSGGQKQRIAIARALVRNPAILILDEATSALDNQSEHIVQEAMQKCAGKRTVIV